MDELRQVIINSFIPVLFVSSCLGGVLLIMCAAAASSIKKGN